MCFLFLIIYRGILIIFVKVIVEFVVLCFSLNWFFELVILMIINKGGNGLMDNFYF